MKLMNEGDKRALREVAAGLAVVGGVVGVFILFIATLGTFELSSENPTFKVVDTYHNCDVVRYTDKSNRWHYFLDCSNS